MINELDLDLTYIAEQIVPSSVVTFLKTCTIRTPAIQDVVLIKRDTMVLLCRETGGLWRTRSQRKFCGNIGHIDVLRRPGQLDVITASLADGSVHFVSYRSQSFETVHEIRSPITNGDLLNVPGHYFASDPLGRAICSLAREEELSVYRLGTRTSEIDLTARRKIKLRGYLHRCCFLYHENDALSLVVHSSLQDTCPQLNLFHWGRNDLLEGAKPCSMPLDSRMKICLFMVPLLERSGDFLHVTAECISLISEYHVRSGDVHYQQLELDHKVGIPSAIVTLMDRDDLALIASDNMQMHIITMNTHGRLVITSLGEISFIATSLAVLEGTSSDDDSWTVFATSDAGESTIFTLYLNRENSIDTQFVDPVPITDLLVLPSGSCPKVLTIGGLRTAGNVVSHSSAVPASVLHEIQLIDAGNTAPTQLFVAPVVHGSTTYILLSLPWASQLLQCSTYQGPELIDVSEEFNLKSDIATLLFFAVHGHFLQVTADAIYCCKSFQDAPELIYSCSESESIVLASHSLDKLALVVRRHTAYRLLLMTFIKTESQSVTPINLSGTEDLPTFLVEPTALHLSTSNLYLSTTNEDYIGLIALCLADGTVMLIRVFTAALEIILNDRESLLASQSDTPDAASYLPHSCIILYEFDVCHLVISLRSGRIAHLTSRVEGSHCTGFVEFSDTPVTFLSQYRSENGCFFTGQGVGRITLSAGRLVFDKVELTGKHVASVNYVPDPFATARQRDLPIPNGLLYLQDGCLTFATIEKEVSNVVTLTDIAETPRRALYLDRLDGLLVATTKTVWNNAVSASPQNNVANLRVIHKGRCISDTPIRDTKKQTQLFKPDDVIYCLMKWELSINGIAKSWTVVGSSRKNPKLSRPDGGMFEGRLTVLRLKMVSDKLDVRKEFSPSFASPIYALCPLGPLSLVIAHGSVIEVNTLDVESRSLVSHATMTLRSSAIALHSSDNHIFAATQKDSLVVLRYIPSEKKLVRIASDPYPRMSLSLTMMSTTLLVLTDKTNRVVVFHWEASHERLSTSEVLNMSSVIVKTRLLQLPNRSTDTAPYPFGLDRSIILAAALDGSLHAIIKVPLKLREVLEARRTQEAERFWKDTMLSDYISDLSDQEIMEISESGPESPLLTESEVEDHSADYIRAQLRIIFESYGRRALAF